MKLTEGQEIKFQSFQQKFNFMKELGSGGTGRTILVKDKMTKVLFAIKKFSPIIKNDTEDLFKRFIDEIITLNNISHNNIVRIYTYYIYEEENIGYIQMEFINGDSIDYALDLANMGFSDNDLADKLFEQAISAFYYLESKKILHRDIRYNNLLVDNNLNLKIIDFGFGKMLEPTNDIAESIILNWPATQMPEEIHSLESSYYDKATEVFFLGTLFKNLLEKYDQLTFSYKSIINKMIKLKRKNRYLSFTEVKNDLSNKIFKNVFNGNEKRIYINFAKYLTKILVDISGGYVIEYDISEVINSCRKLYENNILEEYLQNNDLLINCFLKEGNFTYSTTELIPLDTFERFLDLLINSDNLKQKLIINNIASRIKNTKIRSIEDDLPF